MTCSEKEREKEVKNNLRSPYYKKAYKDKSRYLWFVTKISLSACKYFSCKFEAKESQSNPGNLVDHRR